MNISRHVQSVCNSIRCKKITVEYREPNEALGVAGQNLLVWSATKEEQAAQASEAAVAPPAETHQHIFPATYLRPRRNKGRATLSCVCVRAKAVV